MAGKKISETASRMPTTTMVSAADQCRPEHMRRERRINPRPAHAMRLRLVGTANGRCSA